MKNKIRQTKNSSELENEDDLNNEEDLKIEEDLKNEVELWNTEDNSKWRWSLKIRLLYLDNDKVGKEVAAV